MAKAGSHMRIWPPTDDLHGNESARRWRGRLTRRVGEIDRDMVPAGRGVGRPRPLKTRAACPAATVVAAPPLSVPPRNWMMRGATVSDGATLHTCADGLSN
jgi:hypothetical protein